MNKNIIVTAVVALLLGGSIGYWLSIDNSTGSATEQPAKSERKPVFYRSPMNPAVTSSVPAKDAMGMDYVPVYAEENSGADTPVGTVKINPTVVQNIGVRTTAATRTTLSRSIRTIGRVTYDEERVARLHPKYDGWVDKQFIDKIGEPVKKGSMLLSIYSPQLVATQEEYLLALDNAEKLKDSPFADVRDGAKSLLRSSKERLHLLDVPEHQIKQLTVTHKAIKNLHIQSPFDGIVMNIGAREGERITLQTELYMVADLSRVWVLVDIYEDDIPWVRTGDTAEMQVAGIPGRTFIGKVAYIYPYLDAKTRTNKVRLEFDNPNLDLKPEMYADVDIQASEQIDTVVVPSEAIVRTGTQEQLFIQRAPGQFSPRQVTVGISADGKTQIVSGLQVGEIVVTSSQFLIDSESKLKEATAKMMAVGKPNPEATTEGKDTQQIQPNAPMETHQPDTKSTNVPARQKMDMNMGDKK